MSFKSLREHIDFLDEKNLVTRFDGADWNLEIGAITEMVAFAKEPKACLFDSIKGYPKGFRVISNNFVSERLQALALGLPDGLTGVEQVRLWRKKTKNFNNVKPREVSDGPVKENVLRGDEASVLRFPAPFWHEFDGGRYFGTGDCVITRDPVEGWVNAAPYRAQVHESKLLGLLIAPTHHGRMMMEKFWARGEDAPVAISAGQAPSVFAAACYPLAWGESELSLAGAINEGPIDVIIDDETGLPIPAQSEIVVFGTVPPPARETREEGPFGECNGYYTSHGPAFVVHVNKIWHRNDPILQGSPPLHGSVLKENALGAQLVTSAAIWDAVERQVPNVMGVYTLYQSCQSGPEMIVVSIRQAYAGHSKHAALAAIGSRAGITMNRMVVVTDEDIDPSSIDDVLFAMMTRSDPSEDLDIVRGNPVLPSDPRLDPEKRARKDLTGSILIVNACKPWAWKDQFPRANRISPELREETLKKWGNKLGLQAEIPHGSETQGRT